MHESTHSFILARFSVVTAYFLRFATAKWLFGGNFFLFKNRVQVYWVMNRQQSKSCCSVVTKELFFEVSPLGGCPCMSLTSWNSMCSHLGDQNTLTQAIKLELLHEDLSLVAIEWPLVPLSCWFRSEQLFCSLFPTFKLLLLLFLWSVIKTLRAASLFHIKGLPSLDIMSLDSGQEERL